MSEPIQCVSMMPDLRRWVRIEPPLPHERRVNESAVRMSESAIAQLERAKTLAPDSRCSDQGYNRMNALHLMCAGLSERETRQELGLDNKEGDKLIYDPAFQGELRVWLDMGAAARMRVYAQFLAAYGFYQMGKLMRSAKSEKVQLAAAQALVNKTAADSTFVLVENEKNMALKSTAELKAILAKAIPDECPADS